MSEPDEVLRGQVVETDGDEEVAVPSSPDVVLRKLVGPLADERTQRPDFRRSPGGLPSKEIR